MKTLILLFTLLSFNLFGQTSIEQPEQYQIDTIEMVMQFSECAMCTVHPAIVFLIVENQGTKKKPEYVKVKTLWATGQEIDESKIYIWGSQQIKKP